MFDWKRKKVLVTGAGGFIGRHLAETLVELGASVKAFVRYNSRNDWGLIELLPKEVQESLEVFLGDLKDPEAVGKAVKGCDIVFHLGALIAMIQGLTPGRYSLGVNFVMKRKIWAHRPNKK